MSVCVLWTIPIEIGHHIGVEVQAFVPVALEDVPVDKALQVVLTCFDVQEGDVVRDLEFDLEIVQCSAQRGHRSRKF